MTLLITQFDLGNSEVYAEAYFSGKNVNFTVILDGIDVERSSANAADYYSFTGLKGAALTAHDKKWLRDYATDAILTAAKMED